MWNLLVLSGEASEPLQELGKQTKFLITNLDIEHVHQCRKILSHFEMCLVKLGRIARANSKDSDQPVHSHRPGRAFAVCCQDWSRFIDFQIVQGGLISDCTNVQADMILAVCSSHIAPFSIS